MFGDTLVTINIRNHLEILAQLWWTQSGRNIRPAVEFHYNTEAQC